RSGAVRPTHFYSSASYGIGQLLGPCHIFSKAGGLGDELMAVSAIQAAVRLHPNIELVFHTRFSGLFQGLVGTKSVVAFDTETIPNDALALTYAIKQERSVNEQMALQLGVHEGPFPIDLPSQELKLPTDWHRDGQPIVLIQPSASGWTPNKQWSLEKWKQLVESMPLEWKVVELGSFPVLNPPPVHPGWVSLAGKTTLQEYVSCFQAASIFVGPVSSGMHLAHAYKLPSVIIIGGYEAAHFPYPLATQFGSELSCAPCGLRSPCPYDLRCLKEIKPGDILNSIFNKLSTIVSAE
ncbi:MAG: glycosyltransferase family 9 protein, partial [Prosthecobacter sp.]